MIDRRRAGHLAFGQMPIMLRALAEDRVPPAYAERPTSRSANHVHGGNKALIRRLNELMNAGRLDEADALYAPDAIGHNAGRTLTRTEQQQSAANTRASQPDLRSTLDSLVAEGDLVVARLTMQGTHTGHLTSVSGLEVPPTGKPIASTGMVMYRIADGRIVESWVELDRLRVMQQMGAVPAPAGATA